MIFIPLFKETMKKFNNVIVHPRQYVLKYPKNAHPREDGNTSHRRRTITIYPHNHEQAFKDTLLHEMLHAVLHEITFFPDMDQEEDFVLRFTPRLLALLQDNPLIFQYIIEKGCMHEEKED